MHVIKAIFRVVRLINRMNLIDALPLFYPRQRSCPLLVQSCFDVVNFNGVCSLYFGSVKIKRLSSACPSNLPWEDHLKRVFKPDVLHILTSHDQKHLVSPPSMHERIFREIYICMQAKKYVCKISMQWLFEFVIKIR